MPVIPVKTYYLEMKGFNKRNLHAVIHADIPPGSVISKWADVVPSEYLKLYREVGNDWGWTGRTTIDSTTLKNILDSNKIEIFLLRVNDEIAGFIELEINLPDNVEIKYYGLRKDFIGKGLGKPLLNFGIQQAWSHNPGKVWVHTCEYDHPGAISVYEKAGFRLTKTLIESEFYEQSFLDNQKK